MRVYKFIFLAVYLCCCSPNQKQDDKAAVVESQSDSVVTEKQSIVSVTPMPFTYDGIDSAHFGFNDFLNLFQQAGIDEAGVPDFIVNKFIEPGGLQMATRFNLKESASTDSAYLIFYTKFIPVGPGIDRAHVIAYTKTGQQIDTIQLGESYSSSGPDGDGKEYDYYYNEDNQQISVTNTTISWDEEKQAEVRTQSSHYYKLSGDKIIELPSRLYQEASDQLLTDEDLSNYSKEDLKLMRNEIFASHGYIFKSESLKSYFTNQPWYKAVYENVDNQLTDIEKANIALIKKAESNR